MKTNKLTRSLYSSAAILMMLSPMVGSVAGTMVHAEEKPEQTDVSNAKSEEGTGEYGITINKFGSLADPSPDLKLPANGKELEKEDLDKVGESFQPLKNVLFRVTEVQPKVKKVDGKDEIKYKNINPNDPSTYEAVPNGSVNTVKTNEAGQAIVNVAKGVYLIEEVDTKGVATKTSANSLVQLPMQLEDGSFLNNIFIYPKNTITKPDPDTDTDFNEKTVVKNMNYKTSEIKLGGNLVWNLEVPVAESANVVKEPSITITDQLDPRLEYTTGQYRVLIKDGDNVSEYTGSKEGFFDENVKGQTVTYTITPKGMEYAAGKKVIFELTAKVKTLNGEENEEITNSFDAKYNPGDGTDPKEVITKPEDPEKPTDPTNPTDPTDPTDPTNPGEPDEKGNTAKFGQIDIKKLAKDTGKPLAGAKFDIYVLADGVKKEDVEGKTFKEAEENNLVVPYKVGDDTAKVETKENKDNPELDGVGSLNGVEAYKQYYAKETEAPRGYDISDELYALLPIEYDETTKEIDKYIDLTVTDEIDPIQNFIPMTGSQRRVALMAMGATIAVSSMIYVYAQKRRKDEEEA